MKVKVLTSEQKNSIEGIYSKESHLFSPVEDANGNWVITIEDAETTTNPDFQWVKGLPEIDFVKKEGGLREELAKLGITI